ncbi:MAG TPA: winged helix-turn-helix domain-containing protein [Candidatus Dormibacteraeota bacterium]|nr:winged helix-turn-helix domain-containing protein [Candidatus Dormibacteraeota bacterium]
MAGLNPEGASKFARRAPTPLPGEDIETAHWEDARHWLAIYADLLAFKHTILDRVREGLPTLHPVAGAAAAVDLEIIEDQMQAYQVRVDLWYARVWDLRGLWLDPENRLLRHQGAEATLTKREYQLLAFLIDQPHRFFTTDQIVARAWSDHALYPEQARNYIARLRRILADLKVPADIINRPRRGYSLLFRPREEEHSMTP